MPMIPELAIAMLSCARIGSIHSIVFGGFSAQSIADRIQDAECKWMITADGCYRGDKPLYLKKLLMKRWRNVLLFKNQLCLTEAILIAT